MAEGGERHKHLELTRAEPVNPRRTRRPGFPKPPDDPKAHGVRIGAALDAIVVAPVLEPGFDPRRLLKLEVHGLEPSEFGAISGLEVVSQEGKTLVVLFATEEGLKDFRRRLDLLAHGRELTRKDLLFAVKGVSEWGPNDRMGAALRAEGLPKQQPFVLDIEL